MLLTDFDFELPKELIAQEPLKGRDASRMLVLDRRSREWFDSAFKDLPDLLSPGDVVVINNTLVFPARLKGFRRKTATRGAQVEVLLLRRTDERTNEWEVLAKPGRAFKVGLELEFGDGRLHGVVTADGEDGRKRVRFECHDKFEDVIDDIGDTPLPPYIRRSANTRLVEPRYQALFASRRGAIAAPTAGLHFSESVFDALHARNIGIVEITHHVGYATFQPVREQQIEDHRIESEAYEISSDAADAINRARALGGRVIAVGTTTVRALESAARSDGTITPQRGSTDLFIRPGYRFRAIDVLLTNFHLPRSTLLVLVSAFAGVNLVLRAYRHAVASRYRFFSYGDCMLIV